MSDDLSIPNPGYRSHRPGRYGVGPRRVHAGMDPDTRRLTMFAGGLGAVLVALIGASALVGHRGSEVPVVVADSRPIRVKPENPGGMKIDGAENDVFSGGSDTAGSRLGPPAETPDAKALTADQAAAPPVPAPPAAGAVSAAGAGAAGIAPAEPAVTTPLAPPETAPVTHTQAKPAAVAPATKAASAKPTAAAAERAAAAPAEKTAQVALVRPPVAAAPKPTPVMASKPAAPAEAHPNTAGRPAMVQFAALTSEEAARNEWQQLSKRMPDLLNGKQPNVTRVERNGHTFWRLRTSGFADPAQARSFCEHVRAKGAVCSVADF